MKTNIELLEQRIYDLEMAKMVALQTAPQIRMIQKGNYKLVAKIQSAFVVTIPLFKSGLVDMNTLETAAFLTPAGYAAAEQLP